MSSNAADSSLPEASSATASARSAYHPDVLREQMQILRREAAARAESESRIHSSFESATTSIRAAADRELADVQKKGAADIEAAVRKHGELKRQAEAWRAAEQKKIDDYRQAKTREYTKACEEAVTELKEEEVFEQVRFKQVAGEKALEPQQAARSWEQKLATALTQINTETAAVAKQLAAWGVKDSGSAAPAAPAGQGTPIEQVLAAREAVTQLSQEILNDPAAKGALSGGIGGLFSGKKGELRASLASRHQMILSHATHAKSLESTAREWIATRAKEHERQLKKKLHDEDTARKAQVASKLAATTAQRDAALAAVTAKCSEAEARVAAKVAGELAAAEQKYPSHVATLEQALAADVARIEQERDDRGAGQTAAGRGARGHGSVLGCDLRGVRAGPLVRGHGRRHAARRWPGSRDERARDAADQSRHASQSG